MKSFRVSPIYPAVRSQIYPASANRTILSAKRGIQITQLDLDLAVCLVIVFKLSETAQTWIHHI